MPTLVNIDTFPQIVEPAREKFPDYHRHMLDLHERRFATIAAAREAGIPVYVGTDAGARSRTGSSPTEVARLGHAGLSPAEALDAACWGARSWLGWPGLEEGEEADLVVYPRTRSRTSGCSRPRRSSSCAAAPSPDRAIRAASAAPRRATTSALTARRPSGRSHIARHKEWLFDR